MKAVRPSYLHLSNILSDWIEFSGRVIKSSFSTRLKCLNSTSQLDSTLFQKNFNSTQYFSSRILDSNSSTQLDAISLKIADKLDVNVNHYSTEKIRIVYVIFRLEDDADQQIYAKHHVNAFSFYQSLSELLKHLKEIYEDQNLIQKCRCKYVALKQLNKLFSSFYSEFTRIFSFLNYDDVILMNDIQNKINNHL